MEEKLRYLGKKALARPIYITTDLDRDAMTVLKSGCNQILPSRDRTGRATVGGFDLIISRPYL
jgi:hypothetical protein